MTSCLLSSYTMCGVMWRTGTGLGLAALGERARLLLALGLPAKGRLGRLAGREAEGPLLAWAAKVLANLALALDILRDERRGERRGALTWVVGC